MSDFSKGRQSSLNRTNVEWIQIQRNTFTNWVNEQLKAKGIVLHDLRADFTDGSHLVTLVEVLRRRKLAGHIAKPLNHYEKLQNITVALDAIANDNVRIINIDSADIAEGNVKLILALIWQLILRYQIGLSNIQHKNWMLAWIQAVIPECNITNFTSDWNDGIALHALIEFCMPGLCPRWKTLQKHDRENNCRNAMKIARQQFGIPLILRPEHLASHDLDELSAITYLSYFIKVGAPGYNATLQRIQPIVRNAPVFNFTTDWNDGQVLSELVANLGGPLDNSSLSSEDGSNIQRIQNALDGAKALGVEPLLTAAEISEEDSEHLGIMAYAAQFINLKPVSLSSYHKLEDQKVIVYDKKEFSTTENATPLEVLDSYAFTNGITTEKTTEKYSYKMTGPLQTNSNTYTVSRVEMNSSNPYSVSGPSKTRNNPYRVSSLERPHDPTKYTISAPVRVAYETNHSYTVSNRPVDSGHESISNPSSDVPDQRPSYTIANSDSFAPDRKNSYSFIRTPSLRRARKENLELDGVKVDTYSVGLVISIPSFEVYSKDGVHIEAESPSGRVIKMTGDGLYNAQFAPDEIGIWKVGLYCNDKLVETCPVDVCDPSQVKVSGLRSGVVGRKYQFQVDCTKAGNGELEVIINYKHGRVPSYLTQKHKGFYLVNFTPFSSGTYHIAVSFNKAEIRDADFLLGEGSDGMHRRAVFQTDIIPMDNYFKVKTACDWQIDYITGSPFEVQISEMSDIKVYSMQDGTICNVPHLIADCSDNPYGKLEAEVSHNGYRFPAQISEEEKPGIYKISFRPRGRGTYKIWVVYDGTMIKGSPFIQEIDELVSPKAYGEGLQRGQEGVPATFIIDARGFEGDLMVNVHGPRYPIKSEVIPQQDGTHKVTYVPQEVGPHRINITLDNKDIEGSPFRPRVGNPAKVRVSGGWRPLLDENDRIPLIVNKEKQIPFDATEAGSGELTAEVHGPSSKVPVTVDSRSDKKHTLIFTPQEEGKHYIDVKWNGFPLPNTPYYGYATRLPDEVDAHPHAQPIIVVKSPDKHKPDQPDGSLIRVKKSPEYIYVGQPKVVSQPVMYPVRRYPSSVSSYTQPRVKVVRSPSDAASSPSVRRINVPKRNSGRSSVVSEPEWTRYQKMPAKYVASSPSTSPTSSRSPSRKENRPSSPGDPTKVILSGKGLKQAEVDKPAVFNIDGRNAGPGEPEATVKSVRANAPVDIKRTGPKYYRCTYVPPIPGAYLLDIKWNKRPLKCCPFKINVHNPVYPSRVDVTGDHLTGGGMVGKDLHINVDPRLAGTGKLTADCTGPTGQDVPVQLVENYDGTHKLKMKPVDEGRHVLEIRYNGEHVMGSPYAIDIGSDTTKGPVKLYGPGVEDGILPDYKSHFWVDARGAGAGEIHVSIMGPKGAFQVEMRRESQKDKLFHCSYSPHEPGLYTIVATWSGEHISNSPYKVCIAGSKDELERMVFERDNPLMPVDSFADQNTNTLTSGDSTKDQLMY